MSLSSVLKKIRLLLIVAGIIAILFFIYQIPGDIRIQWQEHDVSFSFLFGLIFSILAIFIVNMSYSLTRFLLFFPEKISKFLKIRTEKNLFRRLTASLNDYAGGNPKKILKLSHDLARQKRINKEMETQDSAFALAHVLLGYVAYQQNDFKLAEQLFQKIQFHKETKMLSIRGLLMVFQQKSPHKVKDFVTQALEEFPESNWLQMIDFEIKKNEQDYVGALESLKYLGKTFDRDQMSKEQATIEWHLAEDLRSKGDFKEALTLAYSSYKKDPNSVKCMRIAALNRSLGQMRQAEKILFKEYARAPNYALVKDFFDVLKKCLKAIQTMSFQSCHWLLLHSMNP